MFAGSSSLTSATLRTIGTLETVCAVRITRDLDEDSPRQTSEVYVRTETGLGLVASTPLLKKAHLTAVSPSGTQTLTAIAEGKDDDKPVLLLQGARGGALSLKIDASKLHGKAMADMHFGGVSWSHDERYVAYVAKAKAPKRGSPFDTDEVSTHASTHLHTARPYPQL